MQEDHTSTSLASPSPGGDLAPDADLLSGRPVTCARCGAQNVPGTVVCLACGADILAGEPLASPVLAPSGPLPRPTSARLRRASSTPFSCLGLSALLAAVALLLAFYAAPSTTVTLTPDRQVISESIQVQAAPGVRATDVDRRQIPARVGSHEATATGQLAVTKQKEVLTGRAQGLVIFANRADQPVVVPRGTVVVSSNGYMRYETVEEVLVPGAVFATAKVGVRSLVEGPGGNVEKLVVSRIEGSLSSLLYVANDAALVGGDKRILTYVTNDDRVKLREQVMSRLRDEAQVSLQSRALQGEFVPVESIRAITVLEETYDRAVNEEATSLGLRMRVSFSGTYVDGARANEVAAQVLSQKVKPGYQLQPQSVQLTPREVLRVDGDTVTFVLQGQGTAIASVDEARVRSALAGKTMAEALSYLESLPNQAERPRVEVFPGWLGRVAGLEFRVYVNSAPKPTQAP